MKARSNRILSLLLSASIAISSILPSGMVYAEDYNPELETVEVAVEEESNDDVVLLEDEETQDIQEKEAIESSEDEASYTEADLAEDELWEDLIIDEEEDEDNAIQTAELDAEGDVTFENGTYKLENVSSSLGMVSFNLPATLIINGDNATLLLEGTNTVSKRYGEIFINGVYSDITAENQDTVGIAGTLTENGILFAIPMKTADIDPSAQIPYVIRYKKGYSTDHDGDWYKARGGDYYLTLGELSKANDSTELPDADYTAVDAAIAKIPEDMSGYKTERVQAVENARAAVVRDKKIDEQAEVNAMAKAIEDAVAALEQKPAEADYSAVYAALEKVPQDLSVYTEETAKALEAAVAAVERGKTADEQEAVNAMAKAIEDAINALEMAQKELVDGTYTAKKVATDITTDASGMIMVTEATVIIKDGQATAIVTMKGDGADRFYVSDTATKNTIIAEAVAEEQKEISGQTSRLLGGLQLNGKTPYTFWPIPITLGKPKVYAARSATHFRKQDLAPEKYYYVHDFQINEEDLVFVSDSTEIMTPELNAEKYINQYFQDGKITTDHTAVIKGKGTDVTIPYYDGESVINNIQFKRRTVIATPENFVFGWILGADAQACNSASASRWKTRFARPDFDNATRNFPFKSDVRTEGGSFKAILAVYPAGTTYTAVQTNNGMTNAPIATREFTITIEKQPVINFNVAVEVKDKKTGEVIGDAIVKVVEDGAEEVTPADGVYDLNSLKSYTLTASAPGYVAEGGAAEVTRTGYKPKKDETVTLELLKEEDSVHTVAFQVVDQFDEPVEKPVIEVTLNNEPVAAEEDGTYRLYDNILYRYVVSAEGYETKSYNTIKVTEDRTEKAQINKYLTEHNLFFTMRDYASEAALEDITLVITADGVEIAANADGSYTVPDESKVTAAASKEGYQDGVWNVIPSGFETDIYYYWYLTKTYKVQLAEKIEAASELAASIEESESEEALKYPTGTKAAVEAAIAEAKAVLEDENSSEEDYQTALKALEKALKAADNAQYPETAKITLRLHRTANTAPELYQLTVSGGASTKRKYTKPSAMKKKVTILDALVALYEEIYGEEFTAKPTQYFEQESLGIYVVTRMFGNVTNATSYQLNNRHVDHMAYQKTVLADGDVVTVMIAGGDYLYFENTDLTADLDRTVEAKLLLGSQTSTVAGKAAEGYEVTLTTEDGKEASAVSDENGILKFSLPDYGEYNVKTVTKDGRSILIPYLTVISREKQIIELVPTNEELMFKVVNAYLEKSGEKTEFVFALSGTGYANVFDGTYQEAIANGNAKENWIGYTKAEVNQHYWTDRPIDNPPLQEHNDGSASKYQFRVPVELRENGPTRISLVAISKSRQESAEEANPENPDYSAAFTWRQAVIDPETGTVRTGNYQDTVAAVVKSNIGSMKVKADGAIFTIGTSTANEYTCRPTFTLEDDTYDAFFKGDAKAAAADGAKVTVVGEDRKVTIDFKNSLGKTPEIDSKTGKAIVAFRVAKTGKWIDREITIDTEAKTITIDGKLVKTAAKAAACEAAGNIEYYTLEDADGDKLFADAEGTKEITRADTVVKALGHKWDNGKVTKAATAKETGVKTYTCQHDKSHTKTETIPKLPNLSGNVSDKTPAAETEKAVTDKNHTKTETITKLPNPEGDVKDKTSVAGTEKAITAMSDEAEPAGSSFVNFQVQSKKQTKNSITVTWNKVSGATGYIIYGNECGKGKPFKRLAKQSGTSYVHKNLKKGTYYKFSVVAYKTVKGQDKVIASGKTIHVATAGNKKVTNPSKIKLKKKSITLKKKGKTAKIKATMVKQSKKGKIKNHRKLKYESSNPAVATVNASGKVTAKGKGTCYIYVYAQNGVFAKVKVKVKK